MSSPRLLTIAVLLRSIGDGFRGATASRWHREGRASVAAAEWVTCPRCKGDGTLTWKRRTVGCDHPDCHGRGGWFTDPYDETQRPVADASGVGVAPAKRIKCLECTGLGEYPNGKQCRLCKGAGQLVLWGSDADLLGALNDALPTGGAKWKTELLASLDELHGLAEGQHFAIWYSMILEIETPERLDVPMRRLLVAGMVNLEMLLPPDFRPPRFARKAAEKLELEQAAARERKPNGHLSEAQRIHRDEQIRFHAFKGRSRQQIAARLGVDPETVTRVLKRWSKEAA